MSGPEKYVWQPGDLEVSPEDEREVDRRLEEEHFDPGEDDYGDWHSGS
jgi:hypothetical protein